MYIHYSALQLADLPERQVAAPPQHPYLFPNSSCPRSHAPAHPLSLISSIALLCVRYGVVSSNLEHEGPLPSTSPPYCPLIRAMCRESGATSRAHSQPIERKVLPVLRTNIPYTTPWLHPSCSSSHHPLQLAAILAFPASRPSNVEEKYSLLKQIPVASIF